MNTDNSNLDKYFRGVSKSLVAKEGNQAVNKEYDDLKVALADFMKDNQSLRGNGYQKLAGGLIIQWGVNGAYDASTGTSALTINFPIAFPNACFLVNGQTQSSYNTTTHPIFYAISSWNKTSFVRPNWTGRMAWIAIGY